MPKAILRFPLIANIPEHGELLPNHTVSVDMPVGAEILEVKTHGRYYVSLMALCDLDAVGSEPKTIRLFLTGEALPDEPGKYLGTTFIGDGDPVYHWYA